MTGHRRHHVESAHDELKRVHQECNRLNEIVKSKRYPKRITDRVRRQLDRELRQAKARMKQKAEDEMETAIWSEIRQETQIR